MPSVERKVHGCASGQTANAKMLSRLLTERFSCRGYLPDPVPRDKIEAMLAMAQNSASWCNTQPWQAHITSGAATERLRSALMAEVQTAKATGAGSAEADYPFPAPYTGIHKARQREVGWQLYEAVGIVYGDRVGSAQQALENFRLFGAPHAMIITTERDFGHYGMLDCGVYLGTLLLAAQSMGIGMVPQAALANCSAMLREHFNLSDGQAVVCGASFGWPDMDHPANSFRSRRAMVSDVVSFTDV